jgi:hypothetical protein
MAQKKTTVTQKAAKAKKLAKDKVTTSLAVPTGKSLYEEKNTKGYNMLDKAGKITKKMSGSGTRALNFGTQTYSKSKLEAAERLSKRKGSAKEIDALGSNIRTDRSRTANRLAIVAARQAAKKTAVKKTSTKKK